MMNNDLNDLRPRNCLSLFFTVFAIWKHREAFGSWLFSLFCTVRYLEAFRSNWKLAVFAILDCFDTEKTNQRKQPNFQMLPKQSSITLSRVYTRKGSL